MSSDLWLRIDAVTTDDEKHELLNMLLRWRRENSTVVGIVNEEGRYEDLEADWDVPRTWG